MGFWKCLDPRCGQGGLVDDVFDIECCEGCGFWVDYFERRPSAVPQAEHRGRSRSRRNRNQSEHSDFHEAQSEQSSFSVSIDDHLRQTMAQHAPRSEPQRRREMSLSIAPLNTDHGANPDSASDKKVPLTATTSQGPSKKRKRNRPGKRERQRRATRARLSMEGFETTSIPVQQSIESVEISIESHDLQSGSPIEGDTFVKVEEDE